MSDIEAEEKLRRGLTAIFSRLPLVPHGLVATIDKAEYDGKTFVLKLTMDDARYIDFEFASGAPIKISVS